MFMNRQYKNSLESGLRTSMKEWKGLDDSPKLVTATPSVNNIDCFFELFPDASLLIVIRDGRAIVESGIKSFNWDFELAVRRWLDASEKILRFDRHEEHGRYMIVKYEDIYTNIEEELKGILNFLDLDITKYDLKAAENLAVTGSSDLQESEGQVHWKAREKRADFNPVGRWSHWKRPQHERFNWLGGKYLEHFGYAKKQYESLSVLWRVWNRILDRLYEFEIWLQTHRLLLHRAVRKIRLFVYALPYKTCSEPPPNAPLRQDT